MKLPKAVRIKHLKDSPERNQTRELIRSKNIIIETVQTIITTGVDSSGTSRTANSPAKLPLMRRNEQKTKSKTPIRLRRKRFMSGSMNDKQANARHKNPGGLLCPKPEQRQNGCFSHPQRATVPRSCEKEQRPPSFLNERFEND